MSCLKHLGSLGLAQKLLGWRTKSSRTILYWSGASFKASFLQVPQFSCSIPFDALGTGNEKLLPTWEAATIVKLRNLRIFTKLLFEDIEKGRPNEFKSLIFTAAMCSKSWGITVLLSTHDYYGLEEIEHPEIQMIALHKPREIDLIMTWDWVLELTHYWITEP